MTDDRYTYTTPLPPIPRECRPAYQGIKSDSDAASANIMPDLDAWETASDEALINFERLLAEEMRRAPDDVELCIDFDAWLTEEMRNPRFRFWWYLHGLRLWLIRLWRRLVR